MTYTEEFLTYIEDLRTLDDYEIEGFRWGETWSGDAPSIKEVALYIMEKRTTEESDYFDTDIPPIYYDALEKKIIKITAEMVRSIADGFIDHSTTDEKIVAALKDHYEIFMNAPVRFRVKSATEAREIIASIDYFSSRYKDQLGKVKKLVKSKHLHGKQRAKDTPTVQELKDTVKELCNKRINIKDQQRKEKIINKIINIVTA